MKFRGLLATDLSGSLDGVVASRNASGAYFRNRTTPVNPNSAAQQNVRAIFSNLMDAWQLALTDAQRDGWKAYAEAVTVQDRVGETITLQAANWYVASNVGRIQAGFARVDDAPTTLALGEAANIDFAGAAFSIGGSVLLMNVGNDGWGAVDDAFLHLSFGNVQAPTRNFYKAPYSFVGTVDGDSSTPVTSPVSFTPSSAPAGAAVGNLLPVKARVYYPDGRISIAEQGLAAIQT